MHGTAGIQNAFYPIQYLSLIHILALKAEGVSKVYVVDIMQKRLDKALELGATGIINSKEEMCIRDRRSPHSPYSE